MANRYIIFELHNKQFREISTNPDADCGMQIVEQIYSCDTVIDAYNNSKNNEEFENILDSEAKTFLYDQGTTAFHHMKEYVDTISSYTFLAKDRILMASMTTIEDSTCKDCVHHARCVAVYEQVDGRNCDNDPVKDCDFFINTKFVH
jgi:hypothetical protein